MTNNQINSFPLIRSFYLQGYRPFQDLKVKQLSTLEVLVGANGSGKSSLFEFLKFLRELEGESVYLKPKNSAALRANLEDFGIEELEMMHRSDELEALL